MIYLASPYSHHDPRVPHDRFRRVCIQAGKMMKAGLVVHSPIAHSHPIEHIAFEDSKQDLDFWMRQDLPVLQNCTMMQILKLDGWEQSEGIMKEVAFAETQGIPITFINEGEIVHDPAEKNEGLG